MKDADCWAGIGVLLFAVIGFIAGKEITILKTQGLSAAFFPNLLFAVLAICGIVLIYQGWRREEKISLPSFIWSKLIPWFLLLAVYALVFEYTGFIVATLFFMIVSMLILGERRLLWLGAVPVISSFGIYYLFSKVFMIVMP